MLSAAISDLAWLSASRVGHFALHAIEGRGARTVARGHSRVAGLAYGAGAAMLRDQQIGLGLGFGQLLLQLAQRGFQILHLRFLVDRPAARSPRSVSR